MEKVVFNLLKLLWCYCWINGIKLDCVFVVFFFVNFGCLWFYVWKVVCCGRVSVLLIFGKIEVLFWSYDVVGWNWYVVEGV